MKEPPLLEVVSVPDAAGLEPGARLPCSGVIGRAEDSDVKVHATSSSRKHCRFGFEKGKAWVEDLGSTHGTFVNGVARWERVRLFPGDWVEIPFGLVLRVSGARPVDFDREGELARLCVEAPHDEPRWRVWADHLLEQGDPLGERIARGRGADAAEDAKALGPLARDFVDGSLEVEWRHGFIRRAVLRNRNQWPPASWLLEWKQLLAHPLAWFLEEIEVDALSYTRGMDRGQRGEVEAKIVASVELLARTERLPLLRSVRFGPSPEPIWNPLLEGVWRRATEAHSGLIGSIGPIWVARAAWLQLLATPPGVTVTGLEIGAQRKLGEDHANLVGPLADCAFAIEAPDGAPSTMVALRIDRENGLWVAEDMAAGQRRSEQPLYVNGRRCTHHRMRPHDLLEPAPGLLFRFVME